MKEWKVYKFHRMDANFWINALRLGAQKPKTTKATKTKKQYPSRTKVEEQEVKNKRTQKKKEMKKTANNPWLPKITSEWNPFAGNQTEAKYSLTDSVQMGFLTAWKVTTSVSVSATMQIRSNKTKARVEHNTAHLLASPEAEMWHGTKCRLLTKRTWHVQRSEWRLRSSSVSQCSLLHETTVYECWVSLFSDLSDIVRRLLWSSSA